MNIIIDYAKIAGSSAIVYIFIIIAIRLFGKKELAQLSVVDLVLILLISNSVQNAMVASNTTLLGGLIAATSLFVTNYIFKLVMFHFPNLSRFILGEPLMLIYKGNINKSNMRKAKITLNELTEAIREHGVFSVEDVDLAVLEMDGNISILSDEFKSKSIKKRRGRKNVAQSNE